MRRPAARRDVTNASVSGQVRTRAMSSASGLMPGTVEGDAIGEFPLVPRPIDAGVFRPRLHTESVEQPMVVVGIAVELMNRHIELVGAFNEIETLDRETRFGVAKNADRFHFLDTGIGSVAADPFRIENPDADHKILVFNWRAETDANRERLAAVKHVARLLVRAVKLDVRDFNFPRSPSTFRRAEHVGWTFRGLDGIIRKNRRR